MSHIHEPCHIWVSHVTFERVMSHVNESCRIWMNRVTWRSHVKYEWIVLNISESSRTNESRHIWMSHVKAQLTVTSHMNKSRQSTTQCVAVCCSVLQCVAANSELLRGSVKHSVVSLLKRKRKGEEKENMILSCVSNIHVLQAGQERNRRKNICGIWDSWMKWTLQLVRCSSTFGCVCVCLSVYLSKYLWYNKYGGWCWLQQAFQSLPG